MLIPRFFLSVQESSAWLDERKLSSSLKTDLKSANLCFVCTGLNSPSLPSFKINLLMPSAQCALSASNGLNHQHKSFFHELNHIKAHCKNKSKNQYQITKNDKFCCNLPRMIIFPGVRFGILHWSYKCCLCTR